LCSCPLSVLLPGASSNFGRKTHPGTPPFRFPLPGFHCRKSGGVAALEVAAQRWKPIAQTKKHPNEGTATWALKKASYNLFQKTADCIVQCTIFSFKVRLINREGKKKRNWLHSSFYKVD